MTRSVRPITILVADDDEEDRMILEDSLMEAGLVNDLRFVTNGEELMDYLNGRGAYAEAGSAPKPDLVLLDLNMPRKDGREALAEMKAHSEFRRIPVFVLTTSQQEDDVHTTYELGGSTFIAKPVQVDVLLSVVTSLTGYRVAIIDEDSDAG